jgi:hypothetical protein
MAFNVHAQHGAQGTILTPPSLGGMTLAGIQSQAKETQKWATSAGIQSEGAKVPRVKGKEPVEAHLDPTGLYKVYIFEEHL